MNREKLKRIVLDIEATEKAIKDLSSHKRDVYADNAKEFEPKVLRKIIQRRRLDPDARKRDDDLLDQYESALGMTGKLAQEAAAGELTYDEAAKAADVSRRTMARHVARARAVPKATDDGTPHDPETGEIKELEQPGWSTDPQIKPALPEVAGDPLDRDCGGSIGARAASEEVPQETSGLLDVSGSPERAAQNSESCGGVESRHADDGGSSALDADEALKRRSGLYPSDGSPSKPTDDLTVGIAPGPQDPIDLTPPPFLRRKVAA